MSRRLLQAVVLICCAVPLSASLAGIVYGPEALGAVAVFNADLDSHFRYLSGIFLGVGLAFLSCVPGIEHKTVRFRLLTGFVVLGGLARALSLLTVGTPSAPHLFGLGMELVVVPLLAVWQGYVSRRAGAT